MQKKLQDSKFLNLLTLTFSFIMISVIRKLQPLNDVKTWQNFTQLAHKENILFNLKHQFLFMLKKDWIQNILTKLIKYS